MIHSHRIRIVTSHGDHLESLLILSLSPLAESLSTVAAPEHFTQIICSLVLISGELLVAGELANVLEASLPHRFRNRVRCALSEVDHALRMGSPL